MYQAIIIDDEKWAIKSLLATIRGQEYFYIVKELDSGASALEYIRKYQPELAIIDIRLPDMNGLDILQICAEENLRTLFIIISGFSEFSYAQKALFHGAVGYCLKPFSKEELMDALSKAYRMIEREQAWHTAKASVPQETGFVQKHTTVSRQSVQRMLDYAEAHYTEDISILDLGEYCSISPNYASHLFRQETGVTFTNYLTELRVNHAAWLLAHTDSTVANIAEQTGFRDYFYFAKVFKKSKGCTPSEYRKERNETS